jgi:hypothetical protein
MVRFLVAFSVSGVFECGFVLVTEIVSPGLRTPFGIMTQFPFGIGASLLPLGIHASHKSNYVVFRIRIRISTSTVMRIRIQMS